jgi:TrmH family RNA methyltransferase
MSPTSEKAGEMTLLTSRKNPKLKQVRALQQRKQRKVQGLFVVEGIRHVGEAVEAGAPIEYVIYSPDQLKSDFAYQLISRLESVGIPVFTTPSELFKDLADKENPAGILGVIKQREQSLDQLSPENFGWGAVIEAPQDPGNLGTIIRTVDAAGAQGLIVVGGGVDIYHPTAVRASMGALFWHPVVPATPDEFLLWQETHGYNLYGTSANGETDYRQVEYEKPALLMLGSERAGLSEGFQSACQHVIRLPMHGRSTSLNLSIAAGILLYAMGASLVA